MGAEQNSRSEKRKKHGERGIYNSAVRWKNVEKKRREMLEYNF